MLVIKFSMAKKKKEGRKKTEEVMKWYGAIREESRHLKHQGLFKYGMATFYH